MLTREEKIHRIKLLNEKEKRACENSLAAFVKASWHIIEPGTPLIWNWHLDVICGYLEAVHNGVINRLVINVPPGTMKSTLVSVCLPAWEWINFPEKRVLGIGNEQGLALRDAGKTKLIVTSDWYQSKWPIAFDPSQNEKIFYQNVKRGFRLSLGVTGRITGKRGNLLLIDDPHSVTEADSDAIRASVITKYDQEIISRLNDMNNDPIILIMQRIHHADLTGHVLNMSDDWTLLKICMEYEGSSGFDADKDIGRPDLVDPRTKDGELLFEARFNAKTIKTMKKHLGTYGVAGQFQQRPTPKGGGILKSKWWRIWSNDRSLPVCEHIFSSWDTAYTEKDLEKNAYSAMTMWGVFWNEHLEEPRYCLLLLKAWASQVGYPALRKKAVGLDKNDKLDCQLIEKKASGISLVQDLRQAGLKIRTYMPDRDKIARAYSVSSMFESGQVYAPNRRWADKVIDLVSQFPNGAAPSADFTDTVTQAMLYLRNNWWVSHPDDALNNDINERHEDVTQREQVLREWDDYLEDDMTINKVESAYG